MRTITYRDALREAIREEMQRDERVFILGEDIAGYGGTYAVSKGLFEEFGEKRVRDTVLFIEHELLYNVKGEVPDEGVEYTVPLNRGEVKRQGEHVTIITFSRMLHVTLQAAEDLAKEGIEAEVIDLRSIRPIDIDLLVDSVKKTNRVVIAEEGWKYYGTGQGLAALIYEHAFDYMDAPIQHVTGADVPMPYSKVLERAALPKKSDIVNAAKAIVPASLVRK